MLLAFIASGLEVADLAGRAHHHYRRPSRVEPAQQAVQVAEGDRYATGRGHADVSVYKNARAGVGHHRVGVVVDHREAGVRDRFCPQSFAIPAEGWLLAARKVLEGVVAGRCGVLIPPISADKAMVRLLAPGLGALPYMTGPMPKMPAGVVPSPSRWWSENPLRPISALHGGLAGAQQERPRCHSCRVARLVLALDASTLTNWRAFLVETSLVGRFPGHDRAFSAEARGVAGAARAGPARVPRARSQLAVIAARAWRRPAMDLTFRVILHSYQLKLALTALLIAGAGVPGDANVLGTFAAAGTTTSPPFVATVSAVTAAEVPFTWRPGCPVAPAALRMLHLRYWGFDATAHTGTIVVNASVVSAVIKVFRTLYGERFPIKEMVPEDRYHGNDNAAAAADDTSGFNCRYAVAPGPPQWSVHAYGEAIDVNDVQNPYVYGSIIIPPAGKAYLDRSDVRPGMAVPGGELVEAFKSVGWYWGGRWTGSPDYQHFSLTGG